ncbi:MAG TPA: PHP-associated domain-containing protein [Dehalococcoidia bacterium]|nr:PHP-associated domain-containing protein [Dehalococcoidia bacterium]
MATVPELLRFVQERHDLDVIAVTEHDTMRAAEEARELHARGGFRFGLVPGMEVTTLDGHLLALWIERPVASFRRIEETLAAIHGQGGIAVAPHPLSWLTRSVSARVLDRVAASTDPAVRFDGIEEYNLSPAGRVSSARARRLNRDRYALAAIGSSDAHFLQSIGSARTEFEGTSAMDLRRAIEQRTTVARPGVAPRMRDLGYRRIIVQQWRGMMATPRNMGWAPTIRSFVESRLHGRRRSGEADASGEAGR